MDPKGSIWICISGPHAGPLLYIPYHPGNISQYKRRLKNPNVIHRVPMDPFGSLWIQMDQYTAIYIPYCTCILYWRCVSSNIYIHLNFQMQIHINPNGSIRIHMDPHGSIWIHMDPFGSIWNHLDPYGLYGSERIHMDLH